MCAYTNIHLAGLCCGSFLSTCWRKVCMIQRQACSAVCSLDESMHRCEARTSDTRRPRRSEAPTRVESLTTMSILSSLIVMMSDACGTRIHGCCRLESKVRYSHCTCSAGSAQVQHFIDNRYQCVTLAFPFRLQLRMNPFLT